MNARYFIFVGNNSDAKENLLYFLETIISFMKISGVL